MLLVYSFCTNELVTLFQPHLVGDKATIEKHIKALPQSEQFYLAKEVDGILKKALDGECLPEENKLVKSVADEPHCERRLVKRSSKAGIYVALGFAALFVICSGGLVIGLSHNGHLWVNVPDFLALLAISIAGVLVHQYK